MNSMKSGYGGFGSTKISRPVLNCEDPHWAIDLRQHLSGQTEVDLVNFDFATHDSVCQEMARQFSMELRLDPRPLLRIVRFRRVLN